jgi:Ca-activated chloride channel family protein
MSTYTAIAGNLRKAFLIAVIAAVAVVAAGHAQAAGLLSPSDGRSPPLQIRDHQVTVVVEDGYAVTRLEQVFHNPHDRALEAIYSFPVPEKAAVSEFTYWIDGKPVSGEVLPKAQARQVYEDQKAAGNEAALAEQDSYKTFEMTVWPVPARGEVRIRLAYIQPAHLDTGIGRYAYPLQEGGVDEQKLAFWTANEVVSRRFSFDLTLRSAYPVEAIRLPAHPQAAVSQLDGKTWRVRIESQAAGATGPSEDEIPAAPGGFSGAEAFRLDQDIVVYWRQAEGLPGSVELVAHKPAVDRRGTFMLVVTPGGDLSPITKGSDWVFVLDKSGSMSGKWHTLVEGVSRGLEKLRPEDRYRIVLFDRAASDLDGGLSPATPENIRRSLDALRAVQPDQGTNLYAGLDRGLQRLDADRTAAIILVTDGVANVGETRQRAFIERVAKQDVRLFTFIMGNSANRPLLEAMTRESGGTAVTISNNDDIVGAVLAATSKVTHEAMHGVRLEIDGLRVADLTPERPASLYRGEQLVLFGHYWGDGPADVTLTARISGQPVTYRTRFDFPSVATANPEIERLWAYAAIEERLQEIEDFGADADLEQAVVDLAVEHGLVTSYTSMVVVREEVYAQLGIGRRNQARLKIEATAREQRAARPAAERRVDQAQPMFQGARPNHGGGAGAIGPASLAFMLVPLGAALAASRRRRNPK